MRFYKTECTNTFLGRGKRKNQTGVTGNGKLFEHCCIPIGKDKRFATL